LGDLRRGQSDTPSADGVGRTPTEEEKTAQMETLLPQVPHSLAALQAFHDLPPRVPLLSLVDGENLSMRRRNWVLAVALASLAVFVLAAGWHYRHSIVAQVRVWSLPDRPPPSEGVTRFAVIGDYGLGTPYTGHVALMVQSWSPQFIATVGDNNYPEGSAETIDDNIGRFYSSYIASYRGRYGEGAATNRFFPVPGHVDWDTDSLNPYLQYFTLPGNERYYDLVRGPVHLFMLDTDEREPDGATASSRQAEWLRQGLQQSTAPWKLVLAHHAPYTSHTVADIERMRWPFKEWGADAVLSGYFHVYERLEVDGLPYFVNGTGGSWVSHFGETDPHSVFRYSDDLGAMIIDADAHQLHFRYVNRWGEILDELVLQDGTG
jgi:tartrate-resistant acid phosphatase type 5